MSGSSRRPGTVLGHRLPKRRFTRWAAVYFAVFVAAPILGLALLLDLVVFGACFGLDCWFR